MTTYHIADTHVVNGVQFRQVLCGRPDKQEAQDAVAHVQMSSSCRARVLLSSEDGGVRDWQRVAVLYRR